MLFAINNYICIQIIYVMKRFLFAILLAAAILPSCKKSSDSYPVYRAIVTVKGEPGGECLLQLDEKTVLVPDIATFPYDREKRAHVIYKDKGATDRNGGGYEYRKVEVGYMDSILTKKPVPSLGQTQDPLVYGCAPIGIYDSWMTVVEDGYITLHFVGLWGAYPILVTHTINLVKDIDSTDPLYFELRHNYNEDIKAPTGYYRNGVIAFDIHDILDKINAKDFNIRIKHVGLAGVDQTVVFHYTRGSSAHITDTNSDSNESSLVKNFQ